jgi:hypothetical protein
MQSGTLWCSGLRCRFRVKRDRRSSPRATALATAQDETPADQVGRRTDTYGSVLRDHRYHAVSGQGVRLGTSLTLGDPSTPRPEPS